MLLVILVVIIIEYVLFSIFKKMLFHIIKWGVVLVMIITLLNCIYKHTNKLNFFSCMYNY